MNQPPLNPDAFDAAWEALYEAFSGRIGDLNGNDCERMAETAIQAYLAAALPEVNSVEELETLPAKAVILDSHGDVSVITETGLFMCDDGDCYELDEVADDLPARVLYRPEVKP